MEDNSCFCCGAEMEKFETEQYVYHYCFKCVEGSQNNTKIMENFASEYENK
jgi:hypothetical protein